MCIRDSNNIFHTLDNPVATELKQLRPDATVGYILAFAGIDAVSYTHLTELKSSPMNTLAVIPSTCTGSGA